MPESQRTPPPSLCQNGQFVTPTGYSPAAVLSSRVALESRSTSTRCCSEAVIPGEAKDRGSRRGGGGGNNRGKKKNATRGISSFFHTAFLHSPGLQSRLEGQTADERSRLRSYSITPVCLHVSEAGTAPRTLGKRLLLPPSPEASPPAGERQHAPDRAGHRAYFPRSFTISKKQPGREGNISRREPAPAAMSVRAAPAG